MRSALEPENAVELFESQVFGFGQQEVGEEEAKYVPASVPGKSTLWLEGFDEGRKGEGDDEVEAPGSGGGECHSIVTDVQRERLRRVGERYRSFAG